MIRIMLIMMIGVDVVIFCSAMGGLRSEVGRYHASVLCVENEALQCDAY